MESRIQIPFLVCDFLLSWIKTSSTALEVLMLCRLVGTQIGILILLLKLIWSPHATNDFADMHKTILESKDLRANVINLSPRYSNHQVIFVQLQFEGTSSMPIFYKETWISMCTSIPLLTIWRRDPNIIDFNMNISVCICVNNFFLWYLVYWRTKNI